MIKQFLRNVAKLDVEEKILYTGTFVALIGVCMPWIGGEWLGGGTVTYTGFGYYTGFIGMAIAGLYIGTLLLVIVPLSGGPQILQKGIREVAACLASIQASILTLAALSVLTKTTLDFARLEIRFGIYLTLIGGLVASLYSFLRYQELQKRNVQELFHYPIETNTLAEEEQQAPAKQVSHISPPKQAEPEEHKVYASQFRS